jgi:RNA polymerase sigma-70 factor (ECF subfamily)
MLGSVHDAEDALQETLLRAWRGMGRFQGRSSLRSWLYTIATNTCLNHIDKRPKRVLPIDYGPATDPHDGPGEPVVESAWIEPYPDGDLPVEHRETVELAFVAALQYLPANQRAVLILREVLGFSAAEVAEQLETTVASVNSALQRARKTVEERTPAQSQQATARALGDEELQRLVTRYVDAWLADDVDTVVSMLTEDATFAMPPLRSWFGPRDEIETFLRLYPMSGAWKWKTIVSHANGQPAIAYYTLNPEAGVYEAFALNVLTFEGDRISDVTAFVVRGIEPTDRDAYERWPDQPLDERRLEGTFGRFGLPDRLDA